MQLLAKFETILHGVQSHLKFSNIYGSSHTTSAYNSSDQRRKITVKQKTYVTVNCSAVTQGTSLV